MTSETLADAQATPESETLRLVRWSASAGSNVQSRGAVVLESGFHRWQGSAKGTGPVDALFAAVNAALREVLAGHPRLVSYDVHAVAEGLAAEGRVTVHLAPPSEVAGPRGSGEYEGVAQGIDILAASVEAYIQALQQLLDEDHWQGATDAAGNFRATPRDKDPRPKYRPHERPDFSRWWDS